MSEESLMNAIGVAEAFLGSHSVPSTALGSAATAFTTLETFRALPVPDRPYNEEDLQVKLSSIAASLSREGFGFYGFYSPRN